ncbi:9734_t:CDS:2 [Racocetra fulgida]|uniref:9734_t:CDS:1 n=1 Tax=Racocetra fulgida TaxID=60492 RepID=A0A9N9D159_9GLOM|nr:9734_t:CDS:2 [Racocetra fulgida]
MSSIQNQKSKRIAIIGSGISGLGSAWLLSEHSPHDVVLYEQNDYVGGKNPFSVFAQPKNLLNIDMWKMLYDIFRFNFHATELLNLPDDHSEKQLSLGEYLDLHNYSASFRNNYLLYVESIISNIKDVRLSTQVVSITREPSDSSDPTSSPIITIIDNKAWTNYGFHEDGFTSGIKVATEYLGAKCPFEIIDATYIRGKQVELSTIEKVQKRLWNGFEWSITYSKPLAIVGFTVASVYLQQAFKLVKNVTHGQTKTE